jgi:hypothetical protein
MQCFPADDKDAVTLEEWYKREANAAEAKASSPNGAERSQASLKWEYSTLQAEICKGVVDYRKLLAAAASKRSNAKYWLQVYREDPSLLTAREKAIAELIKEKQWKLTAEGRKNVILLKQEKARLLKQLGVMKPQQTGAMKPERSEGTLLEQEQLIKREKGNDTPPKGPQPGKSLLQKLARHIPQGMKKLVRKIFNRQ